MQRRPRAMALPGEATHSQRHGAMRTGALTADREATIRHGRPLSLCVIRERLLQVVHVVCWDRIHSSRRVKGMKAASGHSQEPSSKETE
ncbi:MAG: hypothetical protein RBJ76_05920 [Stenomitos frigidus ULC029]